jgi:hypothetical protein
MRSLPILALGIDHKAIRKLGGGITVRPIADRAGFAGRAAAASQWPFPWALWMGFADPPATVTTPTRHHR